MTGGTEREVALAALRWILRRRADFALPPDVLDSGSDVNRTVKPLGELAQLCAPVLLATGPEDERHVIAAGLLEWAWQQTRRGELFAQLLAAEPFATYPLEIYAAFAGVGLRHPGVQGFCATMTRTRNWRMLEQEPNRRLGVLNSEERAGFPRHEELPAALRRTWLGGLPEPWTFERGSGYALTHTVFHLTDWGRLPQRVPRDLTGYLELWLPAWLDGCLESGQWDLAAELLAVAASLPTGPHMAVPSGAWLRIAAAQLPDGAVPESVAAGRRSRFGTCYHSTLVTAFAASLASARLAQAGRAGAAAALAAGFAGGRGREAVGPIAAFRVRA